MYFTFTVFNFFHIDKLLTSVLVLYLLKFDRVTQSVSYKDNVLFAIYPRGRRGFSLSNTSLFYGFP